MFFTIANVISVARAVMVLPIWMCLSNPNTTFSWLVFWLSAAIISDALDGFVARWRNETSPYGKIIDPVADKICIGGIILFLIINGHFPLWIAIFAIVREIVVGFMHLYYMRRREIVYGARFSGKIYISVLTIYVLMIVLDLFGFDSEFVQIVRKIAMFETIIFYIVSTIDYGYRLIYDWRNA